jgi:hypothetical protein
MCSNEGTSDVDSSLVLHPDVDTSAKWMQDDHILKTSFQQSVYNFEPWVNGNQALCVCISFFFVFV